MILVTATPHSGNEEAFRDLLGFLDPCVRRRCPTTSPASRNRAARERLARHFVQRRRGDIRQYPRATRRSPSASTRDETYALTPEYAAVLRPGLAYAREVVRDPADNARRQRVRWWSALALLRSLGSSPAAAAATLRERAPDRGGRRRAPRPTRSAAGPSSTTDDESARGRRTSRPAPTRRQRTTHRASPRSAACATSPGPAEALAGTEDAKLAKATSDREAAPRGRLPADRLLPLHPHRRVRRRRRCARRCPRTSRSRSSPAPSPPTSARRASTPSRDDRQARARRHRLPVARASTSRSSSTRSSTTTSPGTRPATSSARAASTATASAARRSGSSPSTARTTRSTASCSTVLLRKHKADPATRSASACRCRWTRNAVLEAIFEGILLRGGSDERSADQLAFWEREVIEPAAGRLLRRVGAGRRRARRRRARCSPSTRSRSTRSSRPGMPPGPRSAPGIDVRRFALDALRAHGATVDRAAGRRRRRRVARGAARGARCRGDRCRPHARSASRPRRGRTGSSGARTRSWTASRPT